MPVLWSAPNAGRGVEASQVASQYHVQPAQISNLVSAIMASKANNAKMAAAQNQALISGIASGISGAYNAYQTKPRPLR
jgi:hypothetical protein